jgi:microcystin-dependent protein
MSDQYVAEIRIVAFNFAPVGWALCNGQLISISQNPALFSLLGTQYGGNGTTNFALPNFQGAAPMAAGQGAGLSPRYQGQTGGEYTVTLLTNNLGLHTHPVSCTSLGGATTNPAGNVWADAGGRGAPPSYVNSGTSPVNMSSAAMQLAGGNLPHNNLQPYLTLNFIIALQGIFPPRS